MEEFKFFSFEGINLEYKTLRDMIKNQTFKKKCKKFTYQLRQNTYVIIYKDKCAYVYTNPIKIHLKNGNSVTSFEINSNLDMDNYCLNNNIDINKLYDEDGMPLKDIIKFISELRNEINLTYIKKPKLKYVKRSAILRTELNYKVSQYSSYYKDYFSDNFQNNIYFKYDHTDARKLIFINLSILFTSDCTKFKFTGPFNIGKSLTLLQYSRMNNDVFYINLKVLSNKKEDDCYNILLEEFSRINEDLFDDVKSKIESYYEKGSNPIDSLLEIMIYLSENHSKFKFMFIFDQYKSISFSPDQEDKLNKLKNNIKLVFCSSINNKSIRDECIKSWKKFITNKIYLNIENQEYYFYFCEIYPQVFKKKETLFEQISNIKRFKKCFTKGDTEEQKIASVNEHINQKIKEFADQIDVSLDFILVNIKSVINKKYDIEDIEFTMKYCPLKYFVIEFISKQFFMIKVQFPFIYPVINRRLLMTEVDNYFKNEKYLKILVENDTVKGNYFEEAVKFGLKNYINLEAKIDNTIEVKEIAKMDEIDKNTFDWYFLEEENVQDDDSNKMNFGNFDMQFSNKSINIEENNLKSDSVKIILKKKKKNDSNELNNILNKFNISDNDENNILENSIEWHRRNEISKLLEGEYIKKKTGTNYDGSKTYFLEQKKRTGKTLDCGYLYGEEKQKTFIGFQIKCYFESTNSLPQKAKDKIIIKENIKEILVNSMLLLNCKITSWYYYLIFYINKKNKKCNVNKSIIAQIQGFIEILYYDPLNKKFYDINGKILKQLKLSDKANLDKMNINYGMISFNINNIYEQNCNIIIGKEIVESKFLNDFAFLNQTSIDDIINCILKRMDITKEIYSLKHRIETLPRIPIFPSFKYIYLCKRKSVRGFLGIKTIKDMNETELIKSYDLFYNTEVNFIELDFEYFYALEKKGKPNPNFNSPIPAKLKVKRLKEEA